MIKQFVSLVMAIVMSGTAPSPVYSDKGTGESRPENRIETREYSTYARLMTEGYSFGQVSVGVYEDEPREAITSCWNLKTGEQLTKFSDLFYKDSDYLPAVNAKYIGHTVFNAKQYYATEEAKNFTFMKLTDSYFDGQYFKDPQSVSDEMYNSESYKLMPAWEYFDMKPLFSETYREQVFDKNAVKRPDNETRHRLFCNAQHRKRQNAYCRQSGRR
jgi:hypothetical protein